MVSSSPGNNHLIFQSHQLADELSQASENQPTGYWQIQIKSESHNTTQQYWYLAVSQKRVVFSGFGSRDWFAHRLNWLGLLEILQRYIPRLRNNTVKQELNAIAAQLRPEQKTSPIIMVSQMVAKELLNYPEVTQAMKLQILADFDTYLFDFAGRAKFVQDVQLLNWPSSLGLGLDNLLLQSKQRRLEWTKLEAFVPSIESIPKFDVEAAVQQNLPIRQKQQFEQLTSQGKTIRELSAYLGKDPLEMAQLFSRLKRKELVSFSLRQRPRTPTFREPEVFIVDDSALMLQNFRALVTKLGYRVRCCSDALSAVPTMLAAPPDVVFVDVNMPRLSGFQLIRQIRLQPELANIPLIVLTAEKSLSNQMRAKWSKSEFLTKPLKSEEINPFCAQLCSLLQEVAPLSG